MATLQNFEVAVLEDRNTRTANALLIVNPASRNALRVVAEAEAALAAAGYSCERVDTTAPGDATRIVREHAVLAERGFDAIFTLGGDGTAMEAATALSELSDPPPLGIIPCGTANVLARSIGIPATAMRAVHSLRGAESITVDLGAIEGGPSFALGLGVGLDASMIAGTSSALKRRIGYLAYAVAALRAGLRLERFRAVVDVDGTRHEAETSSVLIANFGRVLGGRICFGAEINESDGMLDVALYSPRNLFDAARIFLRMLTGSVAKDRCVRIIRGRSIQLTTIPPRPMQADGEMLGITPVTVRVQAGALRLLVPRGSRLATAARKANR